MDGRNVYIAGLMANEFGGVSNGHVGHGGGDGGGGGGAKRQRDHQSRWFFNDVTRRVGLECRGTSRTRTTRRAY